MRVAPALLLLSCATTATITTDRGTLEATIVGSDETSLITTNEVGVKRRVRREEVLEVDHPGNVLATVFGVAAGVLSLDTAVLIGTKACSSSGGGTIIPCIAIGSLDAMAVGFFVLGLWEWLTSRNAVFNPPPAGVDVAKIPFAFPEDVQPVVVPPPPSLPPPPPTGL